MSEFHVSFFVRINVLSKKVDMSCRLLDFDISSSSCCEKYKTSKFHLIAVVIPCLFTFQLVSICLKKYKAVHKRLITFKAIQRQANLFKYVLNTFADVIIRLQT